MLEGGFFECSFWVSDFIVGIYIYVVVGGIFIGVVVGWFCVGSFCFVVVSFLAEWISIVVKLVIKFRRFIKGIVIIIFFICFIWVVFIEVILLIFGISGFIFIG